MKLVLHKEKIRFSKLGFIYIISMIVLEIHQAGIYNGYYLTPYIIGLFWFGLAFLSTKREISFKNEENVICGIFIIQWMILILYNVCIYINGYGQREFIKSSFVQIMFVPSIILGTWGAFKLFKENTIRYILYSTVIQYIITQITLLFKMGISSYFSGIVTVFLGNSEGNPMEVNPMEVNSDVVLSLGIILLYLMDNKINNKKNVRCIVWTFIAFFLGGKRICFLAIVMLLIYVFFAEFISEKRKIYIQNIVSVFFIIASLIFVYGIKSGLLSSFVWEKGINTMGRINMWDYISNFFDFNINYPGKGYSFCNLLLERDKVYTFEGHVYALHSDILKMYVEFGFIIFILWLLYNLIFLNKLLHRHYGYEYGNFYWCITIYLFILYLTDNAINYFVTQSIYTLVLIQCAYRNKYKTVN